MNQKADKIAIIGNGCAGAECVKALRESGYGGDIHLFTSSRWPVYNPMLTTYYTSGNISFEQLFPYGPDNSFYQNYGVNAHSASPVIALDAENRVVANQEGLELRYRQCLIASGASPLLPPIEGIRSKRVFLMRTVEDALRLKKALEGRPRRALVIGASLVGIKVAELLYQAGVKVCMADLAEHILPLTAHPACSAIIEERLTGLGLKLRLGLNLKRLEETASGIKACFDRNRSETADFLVLCIGVRPNIDFVDRRQIEVGEGILVDNRMMTGMPGLYAAGDVSQQIPGGKPLATGSWANARYQGRTAGRNMAGMTDFFPGNIPQNIAHFMGMDFVSIGETGEYDTIEKRSDGRDTRLLFWRDGKLVGANLIGGYEGSGPLKNALIKGSVQSKSGCQATLDPFQSILVNINFKYVRKSGTG